MGKQFGIPGEFSREDYVKKLKLGDKISALENMFTGDKNVVWAANKLSDSAKKQLTGGKEGPVTEEHVASAFRNILAETRNMSEEQKNDYIKKHKLFQSSPELFDIIAKSKDSRGNDISASRMMSAFVSGTSEKDKEKRKTKLEDGYISQAISDGDQAMINDEAVGYLKNMEGYLATIAGRTN
jgi:hypothetical protein